MFSKLTNPIFSLIGLATFMLSLGVVFLYTHRNDRPEKPEPKFEQLEIKGYDEVASAKDGDFVTISGTIDAKVLCSHDFGKSDLCEAWFIGNSTENKFLPIRIRFCSETIKANCMSAFKEPVDFRDVYVLDNDGNVVDFDGFKLVEPPNMWTSESKDLRVTGRVTRINGVGRF